MGGVTLDAKKAPAEAGARGAGFYLVSTNTTAATTTATRATMPQPMMISRRSSGWRFTQPRLQRWAELDRLRGLAILLMVADHALALDGGHWLLRHTVLRLSLPLFMVTAAMVWKPGGPSTRRGRQLALAVVLEVLLSTVVLRLDGPGPVALYALVMVLMAPKVMHTHPACVAVLGIVQMLYLPVPWAGYQPGLLVAYWCIGRLARDELAALPLGWVPRWLDPVGQRPLAWYVGHLAVLAVVVA